jgi:RNA polymerase sigma factor (sigma-70 family)
MTTPTNRYFPTNLPDDQDLVHCLQSNDHRLFGQLYDRFSGALLGIILTRVSDAGIAENLLQDVFVKAWRRRELYDASKGRIFTWLYSITRSICIDYLRSRSHKKARASVLSDDLSALLPGQQTDSYPADSIGVREMVSNLHKDEKEVIELMYFKGFTQREIARMMNIPLGTVKTRMRRAIRNLRAIFTKDWEDAMQAISLN